MPRYANNSTLSSSVYVVCDLRLPIYADINECNIRTANCARKAECANTVGSYDCTCLPGYTGSGYICEGNVVAL